jgi:hypothetical protein
MKTFAYSTDLPFRGPSATASSTQSMKKQARSGSVPIGGLNRVEAKDSTFLHFLNDPADAQSLSDNHVISICEARDAALWVGTYGGGLNKLDPKCGRFVRYSEMDGLPNGVIYGILEDESGLLWISTNNGLSKLDPRTGVFRNYFVEDGLQNNEFNIGAAYKNPKGRMFFGGINGLTSFFPDKVISTSYVPPIVITAIKKMRAPGGMAPEALINGPIEGQRKNSLARKDLPRSIVFVLVDFQNPVNNRYAYRLEGQAAGTTWAASGR